MEVRFDNFQMHLLFQRDRSKQLEINGKKVHVLHIRKSLETEIILILPRIHLVEIEAAIYFEPTEETPSAHQ